MSVFCFMQFHVVRFEIPPDRLPLVSTTVLVNFKFTSKLCFVLETFPFFGEMTKPLAVFILIRLQVCDQIH